LYGPVTDRTPTNPRDTGRAASGLNLTAMKFRAKIPVEVFENERIDGGIRRSS
jgi:hypothetical protein